METRDSRVRELEEEMRSLTGRLNVTEETGVLLREKVEEVRNPPYVFQCAWQEGRWTAAESVVTYDRLTTDEMSGSSMYNLTGGLDINTGVFTVGQGDIQHNTYIYIVDIYSRYKYILQFRLKLAPAQSLQRIYPL